MPTIVQLPDKTEVEFPDGMDESTIQSELAKSFPSLKPAPTIADFAKAEPTVTTETTPLLGSIPNLPIESATLPNPTLVEQPDAAAIKEALISGVRQEPAPVSQAVVPRFGEPGTITRGVSEVVAGLGEFVLNRPEEFAASLYPPTAAAIAIRYGPEIGKQWLEDIYKGFKGDKEAVGRAVGMLAAVGGPLGAKQGAKAIREAKLDVEYQAQYSQLVDKIAMDRLSPDNAQLEVVDSAIKPLAPASAEAVKQTIQEVNKPAPVAPEQAQPAVAPTTAAASEAKTSGVTAPEAPSAISEATTPVQVKQTTPAELIGMGGAVASEFVPEPRTATGIKNAAVDAQRQSRGLEPIMRPSRLPNQVVWDRVMSKIDQDPGWQDRLVRELKEKPRTPSQDEVLALDHRYVDLQNEYSKATRDAAQAFDDGRMEDLADAKARVADWQSKLLELESIADLTGTEWGRSGQMRQRLMREDFTLEAMERKKREAKGFEPLTDAERIEVKRLHDSMQEKIKQLEDRVNDRDQKIAELEATKTIVQIIEQAGKTPKEKPGKGDAKDRQQAIVDGIKERVDAGKANDITSFVQKLVRMFVEDHGIRDRDLLVDAVHGVLKDIIPDMTRLDTVHSISGYGRYKQLAKDDISVIVRDLKGQLQQISKLEDMASGQAPKKTGVERRSPSDEERRLIKQVNEKKKEGGFEVTDPEKQLRTALQAIKTRLENQIKDLEHQLNTRQKIVKENRSIQLDEQAQALRARRDELKAQYDEMFPKEPITEAERLQRWKTRTTKRIADLEKRVAEGDFSQKKKRDPLVMDQEALKIEFQLDEIKNQYYEGLLNDRLNKRSVAEKIIDTPKEAFNTIRAILTSVDLSAVMNQGGFIALGHPVMSAKSIPSMLRAFTSKEAQYRVEKEIRTRENYRLYKQAGLELTESGVTSLVKMEEAFMSRWAANIPVVAGSQRAYTTFLNKLRADSFDALVKSLSRDGKNVTQVEAQIIANMINVATGRGKLGVNDAMLVGLNTVFFAPRYMLSRFQLLLGQPIYHGILSRGKIPFKDTARVRKLIAKEYGRSAIGASIVYSLGLLATGEIEPDPRSTDFGKMRLGNTRVDPMGGLIQSSVLLSRVITGQKKTSSGRVVDIRGDVPYGGDTTANVIGTFLRQKLSPVFGAGLDIVTGKDVVGDKVTPVSVTKRMLMPISMQDIYETMVEQGVPTGTALTLLSILGVRVQTYDQQKAK